MSQSDLFDYGLDVEGTWKTWWLDQLRVKTYLFIGCRIGNVVRAILQTNILNDDIIFAKDL